MEVEHFNKVRLKDDFGNGRYARSLFEKIKFEQADRLSTDATADINDITEQDNTSFRVRYTKS